MDPGSEPSNPPVEGEEEDGPNLPCGTCDSKGWLVCSFCNRQKTNVQVRANKFYRRCPSCRAMNCAWKVDFGTVVLICEPLYHSRS
ncbi:hypothetical protein M758_3G170700 [Ceratodon purpureus]|nr:hypothetical protein M758_3G170700 [Ceratodon purpureus]